MFRVRILILCAALGVLPGCAASNPSAAPNPNPQAGPNPNPQAGPNPNPLGRSSPYGVSPGVPGYQEGGHGWR